MPNFDEYFPFNKGFGSAANATRWQKMGKIFVPDGVVAGVDFQFGSAGTPTTYAGTTVTLQSGAVWLQGYYAELLASAPAAIVVPSSPTGIIVAHLNIATSVMEVIYMNGLSTPPANTSTDAYLFIWQLIAGVFTDQRVLVGPVPSSMITASGALVTQPVVPSSGSALANTPSTAAGFDCMAYITGGTVSAISISGTVTGLTSGAFKVKAGKSITLTYTVAPTWVWFAS